MTVDAERMEKCMESMGGAEGESPAFECPMAAMCRQMMAGKTKMRLLALVPGAVLVLVGVLVLLEPAVLVWLLGGTSILLGIVALAFALFLRRWAAADGRDIHAPSRS